jgi:hypothetical protein
MRFRLEEMSTDFVRFDGDEQILLQMKSLSCRCDPLEHALRWFNTNSVLALINVHAQPVEK